MSESPADEGALADDRLPTCYRHPSRETGVRCARCDRPICPECMIPASVGFQCPECVRAGARSQRPVRTMYGGRVSSGAGQLTRVLVGINVAVFLVGAATGAGLLGDARASIYSRYGLVPPAIADGGEWWRLLTSMFLHFGILHIGFNMWALFVMGPPLEAMLGRLRFVVLYLLSGIGGGILSFSAGPVTEVAAGASGAIFGLFGAYYVILRRRNLETGGIVGLIVINLVFSFTFAGIDWRGHVGGLVTGALIGAVFAWSPAGPSRDRVQALGCLGVAVLLAAGGLAGAHKVSGECPAYGVQSGNVHCAASAAPPP
jgi:membrane associated rhomboid family serine protease